MAKGVVFGGLNSGGGNIKSIQRGVYTSATAATSYDLDITPVDTTKSVILISCTTASIPSAPDRVYCTAEFVDSNTIRFKKEDPADGITVSWQVIEFQNIKSMQTGEYTLTTDNTEVTVSITSVDTSKSLVFFSTRTPSNVNNINSYLYVRLSASNSLAISGEGTETRYVRWWVVEFN